MPRTPSALDLCQMRHVNVRARTSCAVVFFVGLVLCRLYVYRMCVLRVCCVLCVCVCVCVFVCVCVCVCVCVYVCHSHSVVCVTGFQGALWLDIPYIYICSLS